MNKNKRSLWYYLKKDRLIYIMMLPGLLYYLIFHYLPMIGIIIAFKDYKPYWGLKGIFTSEWVGLKHFNKFFRSMYFGRLLKNTLLISIYGLIFGFPLPIILALFINELKSLRFKKTVQTISYLPHFLSAVIVVGIIRNIVSADGGLINGIISAFGGKPIPFLQKPEWFRTIYVVRNVMPRQRWMEVGSLSVCGILHFLGLLQ